MGFGGIWTQRFQAHHGIKKDKLQFLKSQILLASRWSLLLRAHEFLQIHMQIHMCQYKTWRPLSFKNLNWQKLYWLCINNPKFGQIVTTSFHLEIFFFFFPFVNGKVPSVDNVHFFLDYLFCTILHSFTQCANHVSPRVFPPCFKITIVYLI